MSLGSQVSQMFSNVHSILPSNQTTLPCVPPKWLLHTFSSLLKLPHPLLPSHQWSCLTFYWGNQSNQPGVPAPSYFKKHSQSSFIFLFPRTRPRVSTLTLCFFLILCTWPLFPIQGQSFPAAQEPIPSHLLRYSASILSPFHPYISFSPCSGSFPAANISNRSVLS